MRTNHHSIYTACRLVLTLILVFSFSQVCHAQKPLHVPEVLHPWTDWVLYGKEEQLACIPQYNDARVYHCSWPSELELTLNDREGRFSQTWLLNYDRWVALPGNQKQWPKDVQVNGESQVIILKNTIPFIQLQAGVHAVTGGFSWQGLPENLQIPPESGLLSLTVNNEKIEFPNLDDRGRLWLKRLTTEEKIENRIKIEGFRLIDDSIPPRVLLQFTIDVAGAARQITLGPLYNPEKFTPISLKSTLPAKLEQDAKMLVQLRPGRYSLRLDLRHKGPLSELSFDPPAKGFWPRQEIWSFRAQPDLRLVEIDGVPPIDPIQTSLPKAWQKYPAYRMLPKDSMQFKEIKRGDPKPAPDQLTLNRTLWLNFDGSGYTIQDTIKGKKNTNWRLEIDPAILLGRAEVDGKEQLITRQDGSDKAGIELRNGHLNLVAESVYQGEIFRLPATGWDHDFQEVKGRLHLPPGWKLLNATGIDNIPHTWIKGWTLLDFFIVLIFTIALAKLKSRSLAGIAFLTLMLIYHEPGAPRFVWLALLIGFTLLKYLPDGKFKKVIKVYQGLTILVLIIIVIPYAVHALRIGFYPQLARPWTSMTEYSLRHPVKSAEPRKMDVLQEMAPAAMKSKPADSIGRAGGKRGSDRITASVSNQQYAYFDTQVMQYDPKALTQTGPGMPKWPPFETIHFNWSGPVTRDQMISFALIGPKTNLFLSVARVFLIIILCLGMFGIRLRRTGGLSIKGLKSLIIIPLLFLLLLSPIPAQGTQIPSPQILDELQKRLLKKDECYPACADISDLTIEIRPDELLIDLQVDAHLDVAVPLPTHVKYWLPRTVTVDNTPARGLLRKNNGLWVLIPAGKHVMRLKGPIRKQNTLQLPFPLKPHRAAVKADGWSVEGLHPDGTFENQLLFKRILEQDSEQAQILETGILPPFALVERTILLGLVWKIQTNIQRLSPPGSGIVMDIPLLPGESVTTQGIRVTKGHVKISLDADQMHLSWESFLEPADQILLEHAKTDDWTEIWKVNVSPIFHMEYEGSPVILHKTGSLWYPTWHPWPGEAVRLSISRPVGVDGQTLTIEKSHLELHPGKKTTAARMNLSIKSSQGGQHTILLPLNARLQEVTIKGKIQPIRQEGQSVALPITPGQQDFELEWIEKEGMVTRYQSSDIDLGTKSVNASVDIHLPRNRWPLYVGGEQLVGPAVLFWSVLIMVVLVAFGLSKTGWAKLKFYHWFLLGIGMSMSNFAAGFIVAGWLIALEFRKKADALEGRLFNLMQIGIVFLTLAALSAIVFAISGGLLGHPDMNIIGNGSSSSLLRWYQDASDPTLPRAWVFSIPMLAYRIAMLAWALWISFWLLGILKWGWQQISTPTIWYSLPLWTPKKKKAKETAKMTLDKKGADTSSSDPD